MNRGIIQKAAVTALSLIITASGFPLQVLYGTQHLESYADSSVQNQAEDSEQTGSSVSNSNEDSSTGKNKTSESETSDQKENAQSSLMRMQNLEPIKRNHPVSHRCRAKNRRHPIASIPTFRTER